MEKEKAKKGGKSREPSEDKKSAKGKKSAKSEKDSKDSAKAKKAPSGYLLFNKDERPNVVKGNPDMKAKEVMAELGKRWKEAPDNVKEKYNKMSAQMKADLKTDDEKLKGRKPSKPKKDKDKEEKKGGKKKGKNAESDDDEDD